VDVILSLEPDEWAGGLDIGAWLVVFVVLAVDRRLLEEEADRAKRINEQSQNPHLQERHLGHPTSYRGSSVGPLTTVNPPRRRSIPNTDHSLHNT
jgi:hypothetical protein